MSTPDEESGDVPSTGRGGSVVNVPSTHEGDSAWVEVPEYPGRDFDGKVVRSAGAIDPTSRTLLTEVDVPNRDGMLFAGMYGQVKFILATENAPIVVPDNAVMFLAAGPRVAIVTKENRIHWQTIQIGRDFGTQLEVVAGLDNRRLVTNPTDDLTEGMQVEAR